MRKINADLSIIIEHWGEENARCQSASVNIHTNRKHVEKRFAEQLQKGTWLNAGFFGL